MDAVSSPHHALASEARASSFHFSGCGLPMFSWLSSTSSVGGATPGGKGISAEGDGRGGRQSGRPEREARDPTGENATAVRLTVEGEGIRAPFVVDDV